MTLVVLNTKKESSHHGHGRFVRKAAGEEGTHPCLISTVGKNKPNEVFQRFNLWDLRHDFKEMLITK